MKLSRIVTSFVALFSSIKIVNRKKLWRFFILPGFLSLVTGTALAVGVYFGALWLLTWLNHFLPDSVIEWTGPFLWVLALVQAIFFYFSSYRFITALSVLPFLSPLLDEMEIQESGKRKETELGNDIQNAIFNSLLALVQMVGLLLLMIVTIPLGPFQPIPLALYDGYFMGRGVFASLLERDYPNYRDRKKAMSSVHGESLGLGLASLVSLMIPVVGIVITAGLGVVAAFRLTFTDLKDA